MRLITIDNGNTHPSVGIFNDGVMQNVVPLDQYMHDPKDFVLVANVGYALPMKFSFDLKSKRSKTHFFDMKVHYSETLGDDRLIASYGVFKKIKKNEKILLIDAGTFITIDLITDDGFQGGYIFPGLTRFLKIYAESAQLPLLSQDMLFKGNNEIPHTTEEAILKATELYLKTCVEAVINNTTPDKIILTGGSANEIKNLVSLKVHFEMDRHLIHSALSLIFDLHLHQE